MKFVEINSHRKGFNLHDSIIAKNLTHDLFFAKDSQNTTQKVLNVIVCVKTDEISSEQSFQNFIPPFTWEQSEDLVRRKWDMKEKSNFGVWQILMQHLWKQHQMVVMNPD